MRTREAFSSLLLVVLAGIATSAHVVPQSALYYKFDRGLGPVAVNYGAVTLNSRMVSGGLARSAWTTGKHLRGLRGVDNNQRAYNYCDTEYKTRVVGDFTVHWWMKQNTSPGRKESYLFGGAGSFHCLTNGTAGKELELRSWSPSGSAIKLPSVGSDLQTRAAASTGVWVGLVVRGKSAQWYVDGRAHGSAIRLSSTPSVQQSSDTFKIGMHTSILLPSTYDIDEFRFETRAASATTIANWIRHRYSAFGPFGNKCGVTLGATDVARVGNTFFHTVDGPPLMRYLFVLGVNKPQNPFNMGIAFWDLRGCEWYASFDIQVLGPVSDQNGKSLLLHTIANIPAYAGIHMDAQVLGFTGSGSTLKAYQSNVVSHVIELK